MTTSAPPRLPTTAPTLSIRRALVALGVSCGLCVGLLFALEKDSPPAKTKASGPVTVDLKAPSRKPSPPALAGEPTVEGATRFVRFWFDALNYSLAHADDDLLVHYTGAGCGQCNGYLVGISKWRGSGTRLEGGLTVPIQLAVGPFDLEKPVPFAASFLTTPASLTGRDGSVSDYPGGRTSGGLTVLWANGRWQLSDLIIDGKAKQ